jgi:PTS system galactitol-specific IIA component
LKKLFVAEANADNWEQSLKIAADILFENHCVKKDFYESCVKREKEFPTGLTPECPVAIPHTDKDHVLENGICVLRLCKPVLFGRIDDPEKTVPVDFVINMALLDDEEHLVMIKKVIKSIQDVGYINRLKSMSLDELKQSLAEHLL